MPDAAQATAAPPPGSRIPLNLEAVKNLPMRFKIAAAVAVAVAIAVIVGTWLWARQPEYSVLFSNLSDKDGGEIVAVLQQQNVPYQFSDTGNAILVPAAQVHDVRLKLASQGLPKGGLVGFEVMENQKLGASQFLEQINYQRALEGELARTISTIASVKGARVHLAIPKQTSFLRDEQKPTASVLINMLPGRVLETVQIAGIVHLISSSVPELNPLNVSVIDQDGKLIAPNPDNNRTGLDPTQMKYVRDIETDLVKRVETILAPIVGSPNVKAQVTADVDFSQIDQVAETYRPNPTPDTAIRSQQLNESGTTNPPAAGVPGALTNQAPAPATAPITTPPAPNSPGATVTTNAAAPINFTKNSTTNFEVDKTIRHTKGVPGVVRRLSVAVVVNQKQEEVKGGKMKAVPLTPEQMQQIESLAQQAVGYSKDRGDTVNVVNSLFVPEEKSALPETPLWKDPEVVTGTKELLRYLVLILVIFIVWKKVAQPIWKKLFPEPEPVPEAEEGEEGETTETGEHIPTFEEKVAQAKEIAKADPKMVANLVKEWVNGESR
ncbi:MAG TPA: flagellar basal-body MS-ring/collar protein FliF [Rhodocyclaceae bacterium]|nr:flagellar basal-body MS-ring/collar protein FliF [Rhodocyclaceae bacterium]